jgi:hypothetical protein
MEPAGVRLLGQVRQLGGLPRGEVGVPFGVR